MLVWQKKANIKKKKYIKCKKKTRLDDKGQPQQKNKSSIIFFLKKATKKVTADICSFLSSGVTELKKNRSKVMDYPYLSLINKWTVKLKLTFDPKIENWNVIGKLEFWSKIGILVKKLEFWSKIVHLFKTWTFGQKLEFCSKIEILVKNWNFYHFGLKILDK